MKVDASVSKVEKSVSGSINYIRKNLLNEVEQLILRRKDMRSKRKNWKCCSNEKGRRGEILCGGWYSRCVEFEHEDLIDEACYQVWYAHQRLEDGRQ